MFAFGDRPLMARMGWALVLANARYWSTVAPVAHTQLDYWASRAEGIPDRALQEVALANLREEGFNAQATATLATLAPREHRKSVVEAIVGLQVIYDYLDSLVERSLADPLGEGRPLYRALVDAVVLRTEPTGDYYARTPPPDDGGYLQELVGVVRSALRQLPCRAAITEASERAAQRCAEAQVRAHAAPTLGRTQLTQWAQHNTIPTGLQWQEFLAGAVSSGLALHALIAAAADPRTTHDQALAIDDAYLSICALTTLLDSLIDYEQDRSIGQPGYFRYYEGRYDLAQGLQNVMHHAAGRARDIPDGAHHLMTLVGVVAYYASAPTASSEFARPVTEQISRELRPIITPMLAVMRAWRVAKRARTAITSRASR